MTLDQYRKHFHLAYQQPRAPPGSDDEEEKHEDILVQLADHSAVESYFKAQGALVHAQEDGAEGQIKLKTLQATIIVLAEEAGVGAGADVRAEPDRAPAGEHARHMVEHSLRRMDATPRFLVVA